MASSSQLCFDNLGCEARNAHGVASTVIDDVSVQVRAGELLAVMGPVGAGKTTLLELMSFRRPFRAGSSVRLNGEPVDAAKMAEMSAFMKTDDSLLGTLTVRESITYTLRLHDPLMARKDVTSRVERVIKILGLQPCADAYIGEHSLKSIPIGQRRRVVAACAMVTYPRILFLDEITSGLDSTSAEQVISAIKSFAREEGIFVIASTDQASTTLLSYFSNLLLLSGGKTCYFGPTDELGSFLERWGHPVPRHSNPAEHAMSFLNDDFEAENFGLNRPEEMRQFYLTCLISEKLVLLTPLTTATHRSPQTILNIEGGSRRTGHHQLWTTLILSERAFTIYSRKVFTHGTRLILCGGIGVLTGSIYFRLNGTSSDQAILTKISLYFVTTAFLSFVGQ